MGLQLQWPLLPHQLFFKTCDAMHYFRVKNGWDYQNGLVAPAPYQLLFKDVVLINLCVLVRVSEGFFRVWLTLSKWRGCPIFSLVVVSCLLLYAHQ